MDPTTKHQKAILKNLVLHIYKGKNTHLNTAIGQLVVGAFFFNMRSCGYSTTHKREGNLTRILQKGDIRFYRECHELSHNSGILHLDDKVSQTFHTQKNGVKNATVTQWRTATTLCAVRIWTESIIRLDSYSGKTRGTPVNTFWVEHQTKQSPLT